ncbi:energy transducer TonB [Blastomonas sp.]|uniref:energy transducer TonB n=1 Tax=Blastomonas sp. TaxID=1909299 RepID=UPI003593EBE7
MLALMIGGLVSLPALAMSGNGPLELLPSSPWQIDYAEDQCRLARQFGTDGNEVILILDRFQPGETFRITLRGSRLSWRDRPSKIHVRFGPDEVDQEVSFLAAEFPGKVPGLITGGQVRIAPNPEKEAAKDTEHDHWKTVDRAPIGSAREAAVTYIEFGEPLRKPLRLKTGSMGDAMAALTTCTDQLLTTWGLDIEKHKSLSRPVTPAANPGKWVLASDYPASAVTNGNNGLVAFRLDVDTSGKPTKCHIQQTLNPDLFQRAVCATVMKRAKFLPALDAAGQPVASYWANTVRFEVPR